jgi:hypothetical protein
MRRSPLLSAALLVSTFALLTCLPAVAGRNKTRNSPEIRMSAGGRLAAHVRKALNQAGVRSFSSARVGAAGESNNCVNTSDDCEDGFSEGAVGGQAETSIAVDKSGQHIVVGFNDTRGFNSVPLSISGFMYSDDGGKTFVDGGQLPTPGDQSVGGDVFPQVFGDPDVKYIGECNFIYTSILLTQFGTDAVAQTVGFHRSTDCGHTWTGPFEIPSVTNPNGGIVDGQPLDAADKPFIDVDPDTHRVLLSWTNFTPFAPGFVEIATTYSNNVLAKHPTWSTRNVVSALEPDGQGSVPRFAGNGSKNAYVAWSRFPSFFGNTVGFARSTNSGRTWGTPIELSPEFFTMDEVLGNDRVNNNPSLAVDNSHSHYHGNVYVAYSNNNNQDGADVSFQRSTDEGRTFSAPVSINKNPGRDRPQWFPYVTVDNISGRVYVFYYDQGIASSGDLTRVAVTYSDDGGVHWKSQRPLSDVNFKAGWGNDTGQPNLGDYNQAVAKNGELFAVWAQTKLVGFTDGQPDLSLTTPDVYFRRFATHDSAKSVELPTGGSPAIADPPSGNPVLTTLLTENFDEKGLPAGSLPPGWTAAHGDGANTVPWTTTRGFCGSESNVAFHPNADDGPTPDPGTDLSSTRWERLFGPIVTVPTDADLVVVDFDVCYDTEDDPNFNVLAYDGLFLRITDRTPGNTVRSVLAEAFDRKFSTGDFLHYPKHLPRSNDPDYFEDMSAWAGDSHGPQHVHLEFPGMAGASAQLRFEFTQDSFGTCADVRPGHSCGVSVDNVRMRSEKFVP